MIFDDTELKKQLDHISNDKVKIFWKSILVIEGKHFDDKNLTDDATFPKSLIQHEKSIIIPKNDFHVTQSNAYGKLQ